MGKNRNKSFQRPMPQPVETETEEVKAPEVVEKEIVDGVVSTVNELLNVRETPEVKPDNIKATIKKGLRIKVIEPKKEITKCGESWYRIKIVDSNPEVNGYVMKKFIKIV